MWALERRLSRADPVLSRLGNIPSLALTAHWHLFSAYTHLPSSLTSPPVRNYHVTVAMHTKPPVLRSDLREGIERPMPGGSPPFVGMNIEPRASHPILTPSTAPARCSGFTPGFLPPDSVLAMLSGVPSRTPPSRPHYAHVYLSRRYVTLVCIGAPRW